MTGDKEAAKHHGLQLETSAPSDAVHRTATVHRRASADANTPCADADAGNRASPQHHAGPCDATGRITDVCAVDDGAGRLWGCGDEPGCQQRGGSESDREFHVEILRAAGCQRCNANAVTAFLKLSNAPRRAR